MTTEEQFAEIIERGNLQDTIKHPDEISLMVILSYLDNLREQKFIDCGFSISPAGKQTVAICEEMGWQVSDQAIYEFVTSMVHESEQPVFAFLLKRYRDDRKGLLEELAANQSKT